jgi:hypothetical protein
MGQINLMGGCSYWAPRANICGSVKYINLLELDLNHEKHLI